jgi:outer membrane protein assembly factor BamB
MNKPIAILLSIIVGLTSAAGTDVGMFRGNPQHTGVIANSATPKGGAFINPKWHFRTGGRIRSSAALVNGVVYFGSDDGYLYALKAYDGTLIWKLKTDGPVSSSPAVANGLVYFMSRDGIFRAVETKSGNIKWKVATGPELPFHGGWDWFLSSPVLWEQTVVFGAGDGFVYTLDALSGEKRWAFKTAGRVRATPAIDHAIVYAGSMDGTLYALDLKSGALQWKFKTEGNQYFPVGEIQSSPAVADGTVFFGSRDGCLYALEAETGKLRWRYSNEGNWVISSPAVADGLVIVGNSDGEYIQAIDERTGKEQWRRDTKINVFSSAIVSGGAVAVGDFYGKVWFLDLKTGEPKSVYYFEERVNASPIVDEGVLYIGCEDYDFYAFE